MKDIGKKFEKMIDKQSICYISSIDDSGFPNTKAMLKPRKRNGIKEIYLSTNTSSCKVKNFENNSKACLYFCDKRFYRGLMLKGNVEVINNQEIKNMIWKLGDTMYYKGGKTDQDYCVLKFTSICARYYSNFRSIDIEI